MKIISLAITLVLITHAVADAQRREAPPSRSAAAAAQQREQWRRRRDAIVLKSISERNKPGEKNSAGVESRQVSPGEAPSARLPQDFKFLAPPTESALSVAAEATRPRTAGGGVTSPTSHYLIGVGDTLEVQWRGAPVGSSSLYEVQAGGLIDYSGLDKPLKVAGLTSDQVAERLSAELSGAGTVVDQAAVTVKVSDYESHALIVSGAVVEPGYKILQREAIPLAVVLADARPQPKAGRVAVRSHRTGEKLELDLADAEALGQTLAYPGDVIDVLEPAPQFYYIGGQVTKPGRKNFQPGLKLSRAVLLAGGKRAVLAKDVKALVVVMRQGADGRLSATEHDLAAIIAGHSADPALRPGDRIEVGR